MISFPISARVLFFSLLLVCRVDAAEWRIIEKKDSMTDELTSSANVVNPEGHSISVFRVPGGAAWMSFSLSRQSSDQISAQKAPIYRIDKNPPTDLERDKRAQAMGLKMDFYKWTPKAVSFLIWHGKESDGRAVVIKQLMNGSTLVFRYYVSNGEFKEATFDIAGAGPAIARALGISQEVDSVAEARIEAYKSEFIAAMQTCTSNLRTFPACNSKITSCRESSQGDAEKFKACFAE